MNLTENDVRDIAAYTRIRLAEDEVAAMTTDLNAIIASLKPITEYDLEGVEATFHPIAGLINVMRDDEIKPGLAREEALALAPQTEDGQYRVPPILGTASGVGAGSGSAAGLGSGVAAVAGSGLATGTGDAR